MKQLSAGQSCSLSDVSLKSINKDGVEIVFFGKGVGESILIKSDSNSFVVIDSFINDETSRPIILDYLDKQKVGYDAIKCIIVTHFHDDHIMGITDILIATNYKASVVINPIMKTAHFFKYVISKQIGNYKSNKEKEIARFLSTIESQCINVVWAMESKIVFNDPSSKLFRIFSLSPQDNELNKFINKVSSDHENLFNYYNNENTYSLVLLVQTTNSSFLLGGDYETKTNTDEGWETISKKYATNSFPKCSYFKTPHHGSKNAQCESIWKNALLEKPVAFTSVYNRGQRVPSEDEIKWIAEKSKEFYLVGKLDEALEIENQLSRTMNKTKVFTTKGLYGVLRIIANDGEEYFGKVIKYTI